MKRVITVAPLPPEKCAYALARYSRSPDSIRESLEWVRTHNSEKFLESYYFQYGHQSIADLGHAVLCFENISELAATEIEDEPLWDGQAKSTRYQDFSKTGFITPADLTAEDATAYGEAARQLLTAYAETHALELERLRSTLPRPESMKADAYERNLVARAFDVARYFLFWGIPTNVGQVTSIRTLEKQIRRLGASQFLELRTLASEIAEACAARPDCVWSEAIGEPLAPTLAKHADPDTHSPQAQAALRQWAQQNLQIPQQMPRQEAPKVDLILPAEQLAEIAATLLYPVTHHSFRALYETVIQWPRARQAEVLDAALQSRSRRDDLLREFRTAPFCFDMVIDLGAYRDMHRHRRCQQFRQDYTATLGFEARVNAPAIEKALSVAKTLTQPAAQYLLPFATKARFLFKMDFAEAEYIARVRSGVKGHFSYREIAWQMKLRVEEQLPELGRLMQATPPWEEDPLKR
ncbi:MAG: FAD-dependent thymidylate synthase [Acidobacteriota bacterium]|nr:FAD-dependent thymidylate synthase [Acidobacteriota bacterium]